MTTTMALAESPLVASFKAARRVSTPIIAIETPDPGATIKSLCENALKGHQAQLQWDIVRGLRGLNQAGSVGLQQALGDLDQAMTVNPIAALEVVEKLKPESCVFMHNAHRQLVEGAFVQQVWNLRDLCKMDRRTVVLLGPGFDLPPEIAGDVIVLDEPLPTRQQLRYVLEGQWANGRAADPNFPKALPEDVATAVLDAVVGLPAYTTEQILAMALTPKGIDVPTCWAHKVKAIARTDGLRVMNVSGSSLLNLKGIDNAVAYMQKMIAKDAFGAIVFIDEGDKAFDAGMAEKTGDSGVGKDQVLQVLTYIEDTESPGVMYAGIAGTGKSELAKATAASSGKPLIVFDLGGMKEEHIGGSERRIRAALKMVTAIAEGRVLFIMTANKTTHFTPELNRRFPDQFFFDTPDASGRAAIWPVYVKMFGLTPAQAVVPPGFDEGWTGAEIKRACKRASTYHETVVEAARYIIPQNVSAMKALATMRREAQGRFLSASQPGFYATSQEVVGGSARAMTLS